jgi:hypothetical protein
MDQNAQPFERRFMDVLKDIPNCLGGLLPFKGLML